VFFINNNDYKILESFQRDKKLFMTVLEMSKEFGIPHNMSYEIIHQKGFPCIWNGKRCYIIKSQVENWINENIGLKL